MQTLVLLNSKQSTMFRKLAVFLWIMLAGMPVFAGDQPANAETPAAHKMDFARDVQPILESRCLSCHGPEMQESGFRVDMRERLLKGGDSGTPAIVPKDAHKSLLIERVTAADPDLLMPPEGKPLTKRKSHR